MIVEESMKPDVVSKKILNRLPLYLTYLKSLPDSAENVSATAIAKALDIGDVTVRKDLAKISHTGRRRTGRNRTQLIQEIEEYLDCTANSGAIIVGTGKLGQALLDYDGFEEAGLNVIAGFDSYPEAEQTERGKPIYHLNQLESFCKSYDVHVGVIAAPEEITQMICDRLVACGINAIWNFTRTRLKVPSNVVVQNENLAVSLTSLTLQLKTREMQH